jgi:hypothetical protein
MSAMALLILTACKSDSNDVATLRTTENRQEESSSEDTLDPVLDNETMMMALTECMRDQGIELKDPIVNADGNVDKPEFIEGVEYDKEAMGKAWKACEYHLEGFTGWGKEEADASEQAEQLDHYIALASCLREKNYDLVDPTAETLDVWMGDFKNAIDWDDPDAMADYEECSGESIGEGGKK